MALVIGIDTGGTYTDAALLDTSKHKVIATGKALTTRNDLSIGVGQAIRAVLEGRKKKGGGVELVCLSTTLATNAVVEGVGARICLLMIGFERTAMERAELARAVGQDPVFFIKGGHSPHGQQQVPLDEAAVRAAIESTRNEVSAYAVAGHFATRNPAHEVRVREMIGELAAAPVTCSHELSSSLGGPRRALTAVLNTRLIDLLDRLVVATESIMTDIGMDCPLMVVKGDGSLLAADYARSRPVETVLSGPAASLAGAAFLTGRKSALVADIGGTTTDIALIRFGAPLLTGDGARVGGWQTMVEAADIRTSGLGGDSEVVPAERVTGRRLQVGPRRAVPLCLAATTWPEIASIMTEQLGIAVPSAIDGRFVMPMMPDGVPGWLTKSEARIAEKAIEMGPTSIARIASTQLALGTVNRLISRGLLSLVAFTPTDALHVTGDFTEFNAEAAGLGAQLMARQRDAFGNDMAASPLDLARFTLDELYRRSGLALMDAALAHDGAGEGQATNNALLGGLYRGGDDKKGKGADGGKERLVDIRLELGESIIALGASAGTHYPHVAKRMGAKLVMPENAPVAGAVGAAAGSVRQRVTIQVTQPSEGQFRVHLPSGPRDFTVEDEAMDCAQKVATDMAGERARKAGAGKVAVNSYADINYAPIGKNKKFLIEAHVGATGEGFAA